MGQADQLGRMLGLMFAGADLLLEVDAGGGVAFAAGAAEALTGRNDAALVGRTWTELVDASDAALLDALLQSTTSGDRRGPMRLSLRRPDGGLSPVSLSVFRMPGRAQTLSCAFSLCSADETLTRTPEGLVSAEDFETIAATLLDQAGRTGATARLDVVELTGLRAKTDALSPEASASVRRRVAAALRADSYGGAGASEVAPDRFALVRPGNTSLERLTEQIIQATGGDVVPKVAAVATAADGGISARAIRFALDRLIDEGADAVGDGLRGAVEWTVRESERFKAMLRDRGFRLVYQPIVHLADEQLHHFEALARFEGDASPAQAIRLAEELDLILDFDLAVVRTVARKLIERPHLSIAANLSASSLTNPRFAEALMLIATERGLRRRLLLELTETQRLEDLTAASQSIDELRKSGFQVCLDDFGAGAASLDYLRRLTVDYVKVDGRFIRDLTEDSRDAILLKHLVRLCDDLGVGTVAEVIETRATAELARRLGVTLGQGWAFGKPTPDPAYRSPARPAAAHRKGAVEQWG